MSIVADTILSLVIITNCITFYPRMKDGPAFIVLQVWLIAISAVFMVCRDMIVVNNHDERTLLAKIFCATFQILYKFTNIIMYWLFAFKYWTISLDFRKLDAI